MPRYYIDVRSHFGVDEDPEGLELPDLAAARVEAWRIAERLVTGWSGIVPAYCREIAIEVVGEDFRPVLTIGYADIAAGHVRS